jgi:N-acetylglutamate synthase-like GNAT family acetyltransferase
VFDEPHLEGKKMIRKCVDSDFEVIYEIINDAARAYKGVIPDDRWHEPYMSRIHLRREIEEGVRFWGIEEEQTLVGIMGIQDKGDVCLIRHAYVKTHHRNGGIGTRLLKDLETMTDKPILIGTWADATWAIRFYQKNGYRSLSEVEKNNLLRKYWNIPERQVETSVVLADGRWTAGTSGRG